MLFSLNPQYDKLYSLSLLAALLLALVCGASADTKLQVPLTTPVSPSVNVVDDNFIGISWELSSFGTLWGDTVGSPPLAMQNYLNNLQMRMSNPLRIRIGGNGMDGSTYVPAQPQPIIVLPGATKTGDRGSDFVPVNFSSSFLDVLTGMSDKVGEMSFCLGLTMRDRDDFANAALFGADAKRILGNQLDALILGNEPDLYATNGVHPEGYSIQNYISDVSLAIDALGSAGISNSVPLFSGPSTCCDWNLNDVINAGLDKDHYKHYSIQKYPNDVCFGVNAQNTNITYYLTHANVGAYLGAQSAGINEAKSQGTPVIMSEFNTVSCGGSNISSTFAATLWTIDVGLSSAVLNYSAIYIHTREQGVQYNLFDPPTSPDTAWTTGSPYYGVLFLSETVSANGSVVVDLNVDNSITNQHATVAGYAIYDKDGQSLDKLVLLNMAEDDQHFTLPSGLTPGDIQYKVLTAPSVTERTNIVWANQTVGGDGSLQGDEVIATMGCAQGCSVPVPGPGAVLISLGGQSSMFNGSAGSSSESAGGSGVVDSAPATQSQPTKQRGAGRAQFEYSNLRWMWGLLSCAFVVPAIGHLV